MIENEPQISTGRARRPAQPRQVCAVLAFVVAGCARGTTDRSEDPVRFLPADSIHVLGTSESITAVRDVMPGTDGIVWVLNTSDPYFVAFSPDGSVVQSWGKRGPGPTEFQNPDVLVRHSQSGDVWVFDRSANRGIIRISQPEADVLEVLPSRDSVPPNSELYPHFAGQGASRIWVRHGRDAFYIARARPGLEEVLRQWSADIVAVHQSDGSVTTVLGVGNVVGDPASRFPEASLLLPYPFWDYCPANDSFVIYDPLRNAVRHFTYAGTETDSVALPPERRVEVNFDRILVLVMSFRREQTSGQVPDTAEMRADLEADWPELQPQFANVFPEYIDLRCLEDGTIWLRRFDHRSGQLGQSHEWLRIRADGTTSAVHLPETFTFLRFVDGRIWGTVRDEFDVQSVAWLLIPGTSP